MTEARRAFLDRRREICRSNYDGRLAAIYDGNWGGYINPTHAEELDELIARTPDRGTVLDAACGTGKYWDTLITAGLQVTGIDQSQAMLARANAKHPGLPTRVLALQDLATTKDLIGVFDAVTCIDAIEHVGPEDWPIVLAARTAALKRGGWLYLTVEMPEDEGSTVEEPLLVEGEVLDATSYHYYPTVTQVAQHLQTAGLRTDVARSGDGYDHLLLQHP